MIREKVPIDVELRLAKFQIDTNSPSVREIALKFRKIKNINFFIKFEFLVSKYKNNAKHVTPVISFGTYYHMYKI